MSTTGRPERSPPATVAADCRAAGFVRLVAAPDGDAVAATGVVGRALEATGVPFQASVAASPDGFDGVTDADCRIAIGRAGAEADHVLRADATEAASQGAYEVATSIADGEPVVALAGTVAADRPATGQLHEDAVAAGIERRPGIAVPTGDPVDGLVHSTLVHGRFSADEATARAAVEDFDLDGDDEDERGRRLASLAALSVAGTPDASRRAAVAIERFLRPYVGGPFETVGGYGDVLDVLAGAEPGLAVSLALGRVDPSDVLSTWRDHASRAHRTVRDATIQRHDGLVVVRDVGTSVDVVARLVRDFRSPEPMVLALGGDRAIGTTTEDSIDVAAVFADAGAATGVPTGGTAETARARIDDADAFVAAVREAL